MLKESSNNKNADSRDNLFGFIGADPDALRVSHRILRQSYWVFAGSVQWAENWAFCCRCCFRPDAGWLPSSHWSIRRMSAMTSLASQWNENKTLEETKAIPPVIPNETNAAITITIYNLNRSFPPQLNYSFSVTILAFGKIPPVHHHKWSTALSTRATSYRSSIIFFYKSIHKVRSEIRLST